MTSIAAKKTTGFLGFLTSALDNFFGVPESRTAFPTGGPSRETAISEGSQGGQAEKNAGPISKELFWYGGCCC